jgi:hypothetical protein
VFAAAAAAVALRRAARDLACQRRVVSREPWVMGTVWGTCAFTSQAGPPVLDGACQRDVGVALDRRARCAAVAISGRARYYFCR